MTNENNQNKSLTDGSASVTKDIADTLKLLGGVKSAVQGIENKLKILQSKTSEGKESGG